MFSEVRQAILPIALRNLKRRGDLERAGLLIESLAKHWRDSKSFELLVVAPAVDVATLRNELPRFPKIEVSVKAEGGMIAVRVQDDGPGFSEDSTSTLGRRFVQRTSARGLGLSLSMAMDIVRAHGGTLLVETSTLPPGRRGKVGAAVVLTLPVVAEGA